jgi:ubiquinone/menaquinone biosynthesis C-methylase UbiE
LRIDLINSNYIPALKYSWLTRFYDPVVAVTTRESTFRKQLLDQVDFSSCDQVLDLACGTGTFVAMVKARHPEVTVTGLDGDPNILDIAREKAQASGLDVTFDEGMSYALPYRADEFDVVFSSLFFHHLQSADKRRTIKEVLRVLKPGGVFHVCDWGPPANLYAKIMFNAVRILDGFKVTQDNVDGLLRLLLEEAGFCEVREGGHVGTALGTLDSMSAQKPLF